MQIAFHPYRLKATSRIREGALLQIHFSDGNFGYADCHPWPELGDLPWSEQLRLLKRGQWTDLTRKSIYFAEMDAKARASKVDLWSRCVSPRNHVLVVQPEIFSLAQIQDWANQGFRRIKIKLQAGSPGVTAVWVERVQKAAPLLRELQMKLRLDLNSTLQFSQVDGFFSGIASLLPFLDFMEDPTLFDSQLWEKIQKQWEIRLALDRFPEERQDELQPGAFSVLVFKPAVQDEQKIKKLALRLGCPLVVTSYLDHPFGQVCAAWTAARLEGVALEDSGLLSHFVYEASSFSEGLRTQGAYFLPPAGLGFGMDSLLATLDWRSLE